jgi:iron complex outermembrane receptor protein
VAAAPAAPGQASGPLSPPETTGVLESVVVTAERRATNLQNTPIAITAFSPGVLQDRGIGSIRDLAGQVPNLSVARANISYTTQTYSLRGVGETDPIQEPVLAIYVDDVYQPRQIGSMLDFNDIERVEVLRGPQGTLYGRNSSAGALRIITADPGNQLRTEDSLTFGNFRAVKALASVRTPIIADRLAASLSFLHNQRDGITFDPTQSRDMNRIDVDAARAKLHFTPDDRWDLLLTVNGMVDRSDTRSYVPAAQPGVTGSCAPLPAWRCPGFATNRSYSEVPPYQHLDQLSGSLRTLYSITNELELKLITAGGGFNLNPVYYDNDGVAALIQKNLIHYDDGYFTQEVQLNGKYELVSFTSGLFYLRERFFVNGDGTPIPRSTPRTTPSCGPTTSPTPTASPSSGRATSSWPPSPPSRPGSARPWSARPSASTTPSSTRAAASSRPPSMGTPTTSGRPSRPRRPSPCTGRRWLSSISRTRGASSRAATTTAPPT